MVWKRDIPTRDKVIALCAMLPAYVILCQSYYPGASKLKLLIEMWKARKQFLRIVKLSASIIQKQRKLSENKKTNEGPVTRTDYRSSYIHPRGAVNKST